MTALPMSETAKASAKYSLVCGFFVGIVATGVIDLVITQMGMSGVPGGVFALLNGFCLGAFVYRERSLVSRVEWTERARLAEAGVINDRMEHLYMKSVACLVELDVDTRIIDRASLGFLDLLGFAPDVNLSGRRLEAVLGVEPAQLESLVEGMKQGNLSVHEALSCKHTNGELIRLSMSGNYLADPHMIEASFFHQIQAEAKFRELEQTQGDLERFRQGMVHREERILELKGEVNTLLSESGQPTRYQVDAQSDDTGFAAQAHREYGGSVKP